ncbi:MAG: XTP/dITP diphosphatase [Acidobacteriota bacterium]
MTRDRRGTPRRRAGTERRPAAEEPPSRVPDRRIPLLLATRNPGKVRELEALCDRRLFRVLEPDVLEPLGHPVEDGKTFADNARKKALFYSRQIDCLVMADDSGLEIDALGGEPGVRSARLGGPHATDEDRIRLVLRRLEDVPWERRTARFTCVIAIARRGEILKTFEGRVEGLIALEPAGGEGFGYDPIFWYPPMQRTFAEMLPAEKHRVSHRGQALERAVAWLRERYAADHPATSSQYPSGGR